MNRKTIAVGRHMVKSVTVWSLGRVDRYNEDIYIYIYIYVCVLSGLSRDKAFQSELTVIADVGGFVVRLFAQNRFFLAVWTSLN